MKRNDDENVRTTIEDGDRVKSKNEPAWRGVAFCKNKAGQWLVWWDVGLFGFIIHENQIERE